MSGDYEISEEIFLIYCPTHRADGADRDIMFRLVVPEISQIDFLHYYHTSLEGATKGSNVLINGSDGTNTRVAI